MNLLEVHIIQTLAPNNINADAVGAPKHCIFGGHRRARISSQAQKRAVRLYMQSVIDRNLMGVRTRKVAELIAEELARLLPDEPEERIAMAAQNAARLLTQKDKEDNQHGEKGGESKKAGDEDDEKSKAVLFATRPQIAALARVIREHFEKLAVPNAQDKGKKLVNELAGALNSAPGVDIALFGRMLAQVPIVDVAAACQVAHAISTHRVDRETDFYVLVDDLSRDGERGAAMASSTDFQSATFYRYANINLDLLLDNLHGDAELAALAIREFLAGFIRALPKGKQNAFAAHNPPSFIAATVRRDAFPCSLAHAFEDPVRAEPGMSVSDASVMRLMRRWKQIEEAYGTPAWERTGIVWIPCSELQLPYRQRDRVDTVNDLLDLVERSVRQVYRGE